MAVVEDSYADRGAVLLVSSKRAAWIDPELWLAEESIRTDHCPNCAGAEATLKQRHYGALVLDLRWPLENWQAFLKLTQALPVPLSPLIIVHRDAAETAEAALAIGAHDFLCAPLNRQRFMVTIRNAISSSLSRRAQLEAEAASRVGNAKNPRIVEITGRVLAEIEREVIEKTIRLNAGSIPRAASQLGVSPSTLYRKRESWIRQIRGFLS